MPKPLPADPLREVLVEALRPCVHLEGTCKATMQWSPVAGHVPRGFVGAFGSIDDVEVVIVTAEPGTPLTGERQEIENLTPQERVRVMCQFTYDQLAGTIGRAPDYHDNVLFILEQIWPGLTLDQKLTKTWITESVLCSAPQTGGAVPQVIEATCRKDYLGRQLQLLPGRLVVALGGKAQRRLLEGGFGFNASAYHPSATHGKGQKSRARASWEKAAVEIRDALAARLARVQPD